MNRGKTEAKTSSIYAYLHRNQHITQFVNKSVEALRYLLAECAEETAFCCVPYNMQKKN